MPFSSKSNFSWNCRLQNYDILIRAFLLFCKLLINLLCNFFVNCWKPVLVYLNLACCAIFFVNCWKTCFSLLVNLTCYATFLWIAEKPVWVYWSIFSWIAEEPVLVYWWIWPVMQFFRELEKNLFWFICPFGLFCNFFVNCSKTCLGLFEFGLLCNFFVNCRKTCFGLLVNLACYAIFSCEFQKNLSWFIWIGLSCNFSWIAEKPALVDLNLACYAIFSWIAEKTVLVFIGEIGFLCNTLWIAVNPIFDFY